MKNNEYEISISLFLINYSAIITLRKGVIEYIYCQHLVHGLDAAQSDVLLRQQLIASSLLGGRCLCVQLQREAEGGDKEAASVARGHPTHPVRGMIPSGEDDDLTLWNM